MKSSPVTVRIAFVFLWLIAAVWAAYAGLLIANAIPSIPDGWFRWILAVLALGTAALMVIMILLLKKRNRLVYHATLVILVMLAVFSIADEVGWPDLFSLVISLAPLVLMVKDRAWFLQQEKG